MTAARLPDPPAPDPPAPGPARSARGLAAWAAVIVGALTLTVVVGIAVDGGRPAATGPAGAGMAAAPLDLATVPAGVAGHYTAAKAYGAAYRQIPCFCGCERFLGHRNLYDCFVRADGWGWDAHASGCGVCVGESALARRLLDEGQSAAAVRAAVIEQLGSTPGTTPGTA